MSLCNGGRGDRVTTRDVVRMSERSRWRVEDAGSLLRLSRTCPSMAGTEFLPDFDLALGMKLAPASNEGGRLKAVDDQGRLWLKAYVINPREIVEAYGIRVAWDAFEKTLDRFRERPRMLAHHDVAQPVGNWPETTMARDGFSARGFVSSARPDVQQLTMDGALDVSAGFVVEGAEWNKDLEILDIKQASLFEISLVAIPAMTSSFLDVVAGWSPDEVREGDRGVQPLTEPAADDRQTEDWSCLDEALVAASRSLVGTGALVAEASRLGVLIAEGFGGGGR